MEEWYVYRATEGEKSYIETSWFALPTRECIDGKTVNRVPLGTVYADREAEAATIAKRLFE
jgi:hypothetical protein